MAETFIPVNPPTIPGGQKLKAFSSTDGNGDVVDAEAVVVVDATTGDEIELATKLLQQVIVADLNDIKDNQTNGTQHAIVDNFPATQSVTGPLTNAQLRASAVPVSGVVETIEPYLKQEYDIGATVIYVGYAPRGTATSAAAWTIKKTALDVTGNPTSTLWTSVTAIWDNRATETYT